MKPKLEWKDYGDTKSYMYLPDGETVAEMLSAGHDRWSISVRKKARGVWIDRDLAKAACERIYDQERPSRWVEVELSQNFEPALNRPLWRKLFS